MRTFNISEDGLLIGFCNTTWPGTLKDSYLLCSCAHELSIRHRQPVVPNRIRTCYYADNIRAPSGSRLFYRLARDQASLLHITITHLLIVSISTLHRRIACDSYPQLLIGCRWATRTGRWLWNSLEFLLLLLCPRNQLLDLFLHISQLTLQCSGRSLALCQFLEGLPVCQHNRSMHCSYAPTFAKSAAFKSSEF
jgi:hypothetical protein